MNVLIIDSNEIFRLGIRKLVESIYPDIHVIDLDQAAAGSDSFNWDLADLVILSDMGAREGFARAISRVRRSFRSAKILVLSDSPDFVEARQLFSLGIFGYAGRRTSTSVIGEAIQKVMNGKPYMESYLVIDYLLSEGEENEITTPALGKRLSDKEQELVNYLVQGFKTNEISRLLQKKATTISRQKANIYNKLNVGSVVELLPYVHRNTNGKNSISIIS